MAADRPAPRWRKSSYSSGNGENCVEVAGSPDAVVVRDSKNQDGPELSFSRGAFAAFLNNLDELDARGREGHGDGED
ncbi:MULTISPECIES: DUF397 domain-containing protein [unclassified Crossiella]|uniref:DUF397 domain-containing protein n=1 Tax=unclassified Crossiella TaxID=2620835 RepID=UPI001FFEC5E9|nr:MULTISPECIES: DUF397 domain-containing protein [unclassified Crossiella]MCK2242048.1 DUF397 domain-containing protein [Crossiella sp. S99.2]MCK2255951.1 DUF397 domain-containing protein [Crossiella sp. S99.1]